MSLPRRGFLASLGLTAGGLLVPQLIKPAPKVFDMGRSIRRSSRARILFYSGSMPNVNSSPTGRLVDVREIEDDLVLPARNGSVVWQLRDKSILSGVPDYARVELQDGATVCQVNKFDLFGYCDLPKGSKLYLSALRISMI
jgi:hypothetical protein